MMRYTRLFVFFGAFAALLVSGCSDRGTNVPQEPPKTGWSVDYELKHVFVPPSTDSLPSQLLLQIKNPPSLLQMAAYIPDSTVVSIPAKYRGKPMPLLILLPPQNADKFFFFDHGLSELAGEMIADGTIRPMVIVTLANDKTYGGYFYGNSTPAGHMDDIIGDKLITWLNSVLLIPGLIDDQTHRGIGGIGMGSYGAFRAALKHPGVFGSISVNDGPLDFDGATGSGGLISLIPRVFAEQPWLTLHNFKHFKQLFDSSVVWPYSNMFIGGSLAFSIHDTLVVVKVDTLEGRTLRITRRAELADSTTLIADAPLVTGPKLGTSASATFAWPFHLPFDSTGHIYGPTWSRWMANNLDSLMAQAGADPLGNVGMWIATTTEAESGFHEMTTSWIGTLENAGYSPTVFNYSGSATDPATQNTYVYNLIRQMLVFHSNVFGE